MDFDYQNIKDVENVNREQLNNTLPAQPVFEPVPRQCSAAHDPPIRQTPPIKPRRSLKAPRSPREQVEPLPKPAGGQENKAVVKRLSPALTLGSAGLLEPLSSCLRAQTLLWFERSQLPCLRQPGRRLPCWLHGFATRREAEDLLKDKHLGCFLLRLSESKIGFVLSYRGKDGCRHFIIEQEAREAGDGGPYLIAGEESRHATLQELVSYYTQNPVGPFDELLTTPCDQSSGVSEKAIKLQVQSESGGDTAEASGNTCGDRKQNVLASSLPAPSASETETQPPSPASCAPADKDSTAEYAVVKKALKKSRSLPENQRGELNALEGPNLNPPPQNEVARCDLGSPGACGGQDSTEVQYAKVNKPPRVGVSQTTHSTYVNINSPPDHQGAPVPTAPLTRRGSAGEPGYWRLDPLHTYEETPFLGRRQESDEQIDFYAVGRLQDTQTSAERHLYSEVNIKSTRESPGHVRPSDKAAPSLPSRPPPSRAIHTQPRPDPSVQRSGERLPLLSSTSRPETSWPPRSELPSTGDLGSSIYEQISERPVASSRPPLPPPNPQKRVL